MNDSNNLIHVALGVYDPRGTYSRHVGVLMTSLFVAASGQVRVTVLHDETLSEDNRSRMRRTGDVFGQDVCFLDLSSSVSRLGADLEGIVGHFSRGCLFRLFIPEVLQVSKAIYLDCDIAVDLDIAELWNLPLEDASLAAAKDATIVSRSGKRHERLRSWAMGYDGREYFNSGVLLMNLDRIRRKFDLVEESVRFFKRYAHVCSYPDQDFLNVLFRGDVRFIDERFNRITERRDIKDSIMHLTGKYKPWTFHLCDPRDIFYWRTFARSEWKDQLVDAMLEMYKANPTAHPHSSDCMKRLLTRWKKDLLTNNGLVKLGNDLRIYATELRRRMSPE